MTPKPLRGVPLVRPTGLQLLIANNPPFLLDVDSGRVTPVTGLRVRGASALSVLAVGNDAVVVRYGPAAEVPAAAVYVVHHGTATATRLGTAWGVAAAGDGRSVWLLSFEDGGHCALRKVGLDGRQRRRARPTPCSTFLAPAGSVGLIVARETGESVVDPANGRTLLRAGDVLAVVGHLVLTSAERVASLTLTDLRSGASDPLAWPSQLSETDEAAVQPQGQLIALAFADPAYQGGPTQALDVWLFDPTTGRLQQLPDMPADVALKFTSMTWTSDGQLVMLAKTADRDVVAVWRPGETRIAVRPVRLPRRNSGSDSFVVW